MNRHTAHLLTTVMITASLASAETTVPHGIAQYGFGEAYANVYDYGMYFDGNLFGGIEDQLQDGIFTDGPEVDRAWSYGGSEDLPSYDLSMSGDRKGVTLSGSAQTSSQYETQNEFVSWRESQVFLEMYKGFSVDQSTEFDLNVMSQAGPDSDVEFRLAQTNVGPDSEFVVLHSGSTQGAKNIYNEVVRLGPGTYSFQIELFVESPYVVGEGQIYEEQSGSIDAALTVVPGPGTLALLPIGLLAARRRR